MDEIKLLAFDKSHHFVCTAIKRMFIVHYATLQHCHHWGNDNEKFQKVSDLLSTVKRVSANLNAYYTDQLFVQFLWNERNHISEIDFQHIPNQDRSEFDSISNVRVMLITKLSSINFKLQV